MDCFKHCVCLPGGQKLTLANDGTAVRSGGFSVVAFDRLPQGLLILYGTYPFRREIIFLEMPFSN